MILQLFHFWGDFQDQPSTFPRSSCASGDTPKNGIHPRKLTAGYPKWWLAKGDSIQTQPFVVSMLDFWGVNLLVDVWYLSLFLELSNRNSCFRQKNRITRNLKISECIFKKHPQNPRCSKGFEKFRKCSLRCLIIESLRHLIGVKVTQKTTLASSFNPFEKY